MAFSATTSARLSASTSIGLAVATSATRIRINSQRSVSHCRGLGDSDCWHGGWLEKDVRRADIELVPCVVRAHRTISGSNSVRPFCYIGNYSQHITWPERSHLVWPFYRNNYIVADIRWTKLLSADTSIRSCSLS